MISVLYVGAADLARPSAGLDLACRAHFEELSDDPRLGLTAISVSPLTLDPALSPRRPATLLQGDLATLTNGAARLRKKLIHLARGGILFHAGLISDRARRVLRDALMARPKVLVLDNVGAMSNFSLLRLLALRMRGRTKVLVIAHDTSAEVIRDRAKLHPSRTRGMLIWLSALHSHLFDLAVFWLANRVVFLSETDRARAVILPAAKTQTLCVLADDSPASPDLSHGPPYLLFVGSPSFFPNAFAIEWLEKEFAPALATLLPDIPILLVGKNTDRPSPTRSANLRGLGFVDEARLQNLLHGAIGLLCPVIHGSGIKIKVLEALAAGCPVFATEQSLRGYEFMELEPLLRIDDPAGSAARVAAIASNPLRLDEHRQRTRSRWADYARERRGKLADIVAQLAAEA